VTDGLSSISHIRWCWLNRFSSGVTPAPFRKTGWWGERRRQGEEGKREKEDREGTQQREKSEEEGEEEEGEEFISVN